MHIGYINEVHKGYHKDIPSTFQVTEKSQPKNNQNNPPNKQNKTPGRYFWGGVEKVSPATPWRERPPQILRHTRFSGFRESRVQGETATETGSARPPRASPPSPGASPRGDPGTAPASHPPGLPEPRGACLACAPATARAANRAWLN